uniref:BPTI/Kunitz inhibitor domain-containing protein n=1 Tax=Plectus sambesii TaxID=2011161 RepID=A0A914X943_9BILA
MFSYSCSLAVSFLFLTVAFCQSVTESPAAENLVTDNQVTDGPATLIPVTEEVLKKPRTICDAVRCPLDLKCEAITASCVQPPCPKYRCVKHLTCLPKPVPVGCRVIAYKKDEAGCPDVDLDCVFHDTDVLRRCRQIADSGWWCLRTARRWYYDRSSGKCHEFIFGGCAGNDNNFSSEDECNQVCENVFPCPPVVAYK